MPDFDFSMFADETPATDTTTDSQFDFSMFGEATPAYEPEWDWQPIDRIVKSTRETGAALTGLFALGADALGAEGVRDTLIQKSSDMFENIENDYWSLATTEFKDAVTSPTDFLKFGSELITSYLPDLALMILAGSGAATGAVKAASTTVGKKVVTGIAKKTLAKELEGALAKGLTTEAAQAAAIKSTARVIGQMGGMSLYEGALGAGSGYLGDVETRGADEASPMAALGLGAATSAISLLSPVNRMISSSFGQKVMTKKGLRDAAEMTLGEAGEEFGQELVAVVHETGTNPNLTLSEAMSDPDTAWRLAESGFSGMLLGGLFGGGAVGLSKMAKEKTNIEAELKDAGLDDESLDVTLTGFPKLPEDIEREKSLQYLQEKQKKGEPLSREEQDYLAYQPEAPSDYRAAIEGDVLETFTTPMETRTPADVVSPEGPQGIIPSTAEEAAKVFQTTPTTEAGAKAEARVQKQEDLEAVFPFQAILEEVKPEAPTGFTKRMAVEIRDATTNEEVTTLLTEFGVPKRFIPAVAKEVAALKEPAPVSPYVTEEGGVAKVTDTTLSPEDIITKQEEVAEVVTPEVDIDETISIASEATTNPLTKALLEGDQDTVASVLSKSMKKDREALFIEAGQEAVALARENNLTDFIETNISEAYDTNFKRVGTRTDTQAKWTQELDTVYTGKIAGEEYMISEMDSNIKGKNWSILKRVDGKWEPMGTSKSATQAKAAVDKLFNEEPIAGDATTLVRDLAKSKNVAVSAIAKAVSTIAGDKLGDIKIQTDAGSNYYHDKLNRISLTPDSTDIVKLHEVVHSVTARELKADKASQNVLNGIRKTLRETLLKEGKLTKEDIVSFRDNKDKYTGETAELLYALSSTDELLAVGLTSPTLQKTLKGIKAKSPVGKIKTLWDQIVSLVGKALGLSPLQYTQLDRLLATFADLAAQTPTEVKGKGKTYEYFAIGGDAANVDRGVLAQAAMLKDSGVSKEEVKKQTGWMWRSDEQMRYLVTTEDFKIDDTVLFNKMKDQGVLKTLNDVIQINNDLSDVQDTLADLRDELSNQEDILAEREEDLSPALRNKLAEEIAEMQQEELDLAIKEADLQVRLAEVDTKDVYSVKMKDYYDPNTQAAKAYPSILGNTDIIFIMDTDVGYLGGAEYSKSPDVPHRIKINLLATRADVNPTIIHEYQHLIQSHEGFGLGTAPTWVKENTAVLMFNEFFQILKKHASPETIKQAEVLREQAYANQEQRMGELGGDAQLLNDFAAIEFFENIKKNETLRELIYNPENSAYSQIESLQEALYVSADSRPVKDLAHKLYEAALGEMESREAAEMMDTSTEELRKHIPDDIYVLDERTGESIPAIIIRAGDGELYAASESRVVGIDKAGNFFEALADNTARKTITEKEYRAAKEASRSAKEKRIYDAGMEHSSAGMSLRDKTAHLGKSTTKLTKDLFESVYFRLKSISPKLGELLRRAEFQIARDESNWRKGVRSYVEGYRDMDGGDKLLFKHALVNKDVALRDRLLSKYGLAASWKGVEKTLKEIEDRAIKIGLIHSGVKDYYPNRVIDFDAFMEFFYEGKDSKEFGPFDYIVKQREKELGRELTDVESAQLMHDSIMSGNYGSVPLPGAAKHRTVHYVPQGGLAAYADPILAMHQHITDMAEALNFRERLGSTSRKTTMQQLNSIDKQVEAVEKKLTVSPTNAALITEREKLIEAFETKREQLIDAEADLLNSISNVVATSVKDGKKQEEAKDLIRARVKQKGVHGILGNLRDLSYMAVLANPMSALTQLADNAVTLFNEGPKHTFLGWKETLPRFFKKGDGMISVEKLDLARSTTEFSNSSTSKMLDTALHYSGLKGFDLLGKEVSMRATKSKWEEVAKNNDWKKFSDKWSEILGKDTRKTFQHLKEGKESEEVLFMVFNSLADRQPIALSQMPKAYLLGGQGRILYMLRSFSLTFLNMALNNAKTDWKKGNHKTAVLQLTYLFALMSMAGAGTDELKSWLTGADEAFSDNVMDNFVQLLMINKYALKKGEQTDAFITATVGGYLPPLRFVDDAVADIWALTFGEKDLKFKTMRNVPIIGKVTYAHMEGGQKSQLYGSKDRIFSKVKGGTPASKMRSEISRHNKKAREVGATDMIITYDSLRKAVEKKKKGRK